MKRKFPEEATDHLYASENKDNQSEQEKWPRPPLPDDFSAETHSVTFQQMDLKYVIEKTPPFCAKTTTEPSVPVIKMFGCSQEGYSVALSVYNFMPYIYASAPELDESGGLTDKELSHHFKHSLDVRMRNKASSSAEQPNDYVLAVEIVEKMSIMFYREACSRFYKITFTSPTYVPSARSILEQEDQLLTYESNIAYVLRFMVDCGIGGASWVQLPAGKYRLVEHRKCNTTIEAEIDYRNLVAFKVDDDAWSHIAPLRLLSFDIECAGRPGIFPDPQIDPVIQIANYVAISGQEKPLLTNIFVLDTCTPISGVDVRCFRTELEMLREWARFVLLVDPDLLTGYNIVNFDLTYLKSRAEALRLKDFDFYTRVKEKKASVKDAKFSSAQTGTRESKEWTIDGRVIFDVYQVVQRDHKLSSYTLNNVSSHFLKQQKEDVHHSMITKLHQGTADDRRRLAVYCCKDAYLPLKLISSLMCLVNYVEMARVTGVPFSFLLTRGQSIKVVSQILRKALEMGLLIPSSRDHDGPAGFKGATVIDPVIGFYDLPIFTVDFASLYPSIMQAHNLCYTTLIPRGQPAPAGFVEGVDYEVTPTGERFVCASRKKGILTLILESLLDARGKAKRLMNNATDKLQQQVYNGRQLALKVSANSVYGFTGQAVGSIPCLEISSSVTGYGREMIFLTKQVIEEEYCIKNGYSHDATIIYGDTDSVMVCSGVKTVEEAIKMGQAAAKLVTTKFPRPIKLEFEKVYYPWLLMAKKKYAGLFWTKAEKWDKIDCKGIESVRRDNCGIVRYVVDVVLKKILIQQDVASAIDFCKGIISDILQNKIDLSLLIITKAYSREADAYKNPQAHIALAQKMAKRNPATAPSVGDRIPYVIVKGEKKSKMCDKAEDPLYVLEHDVPIDSQYYIEQLISPVCRLFRPMVDNPEALLTTGEHTRHIVIPRSKVGATNTSSLLSKGLGAFVVVRENCMGCRAPLATGEKTLCRACAQHATDIYAKYLYDAREKEMQFSRLWTHCQNCQGSMHMEVICSANDCPIFYKRTKVYKENVEAQKALAKFNDISW